MSATRARHAGEQPQDPKQNGKAYLDRLKEVEESLQPLAELEACWGPVRKKCEDQIAYIRLELLNYDKISPEGFTQSIVRILERWRQLDTFMNLPEDSRKTIEMVQTKREEYLTQNPDAVVRKKREPSIGLDK